MNTQKYYTQQQYIIISTQSCIKLITIKAGSTSEKLSSNKNKTIHSITKKRKITILAKHKSTKLTKNS